MQNIIGGSMNPIQLIRLNAIVVTLPTHLNATAPLPHLEHYPLILMQL
jgi:hypothetical protein